jgi:hypothetical protein
MMLLRLFVQSPWLALLPAFAFGITASRRRRPLVRAAAVAWLAYAGYETLMARRVFCAGECNIRIDLLLLYPILLALSVAAAVSAMRVAGPGMPRRPPAGRRTPPPESPASTHEGS